MVGNWVRSWFNVLFFNFHHRGYVGGNGNVPVFNRHKFVVVFAVHLHMTVEAVNQTALGIVNLGELVCYWFKYIGVFHIKKVLVVFLRRVFCYQSARFGKYEKAHSQQCYSLPF